MALYVYAVTKSSHPLDVDDLTGVGGDDSPVRTVRGDSLCAVVSEAPDNVRVKRADIEAHQAVQERLWRDGPTLPLGFGFVAEDEDAVRAVLEGGADQFAQRLDELTDRVEFNVKGVQEEDAVLRQIVAESEPIRELNAATREGGGTYEQRLELGQLLHDEVQARQAALAESVLATLRPHARAERLSEPSQQYLLNASFLVDQEGTEEFTRAVQEATGELPDGVEVRVRGPLPPYSFA
ncbi:GvpL/GvpF family gas vesicle protein [Streptomyces sp. NPDC048018]|uniref:GvpL/GvpF family gas vesicle protein n=1 Tax=Streptomyces sp. NPDC048018 TaxID=3365499 RepID=UPI003720FDAD